MPRFPILAGVGLAMLLLLGGCSTSSTVVTGETRAPTDPSTLQIYREVPPVFEEIGLVQANSKGAMAFTEQEKSDVAIERLKEAAAELGANGIILESMTDEYGGSFSLGFGTGTYSGSGGASVGVGSSTATSFKMASGVAIWVPGDYSNSTLNRK